MDRPHISVIGAGLAGCEAAYRAARRGAEVSLYEMRPEHTADLYRTGAVAELAATNSLGIERLNKASGLLLEELRILGSLVASAADSARIGNGFEVEVDVEQFSSVVREGLESTGHVTLIHEQVTPAEVDGPTVICTGPQTPPSVARELYRIVDEKYLFYYGATEPLVSGATVDHDLAWRQRRFDEDNPEYLNCALDEGGFETFVGAMESGRGRYDDLTGVDFFPPFMPLEIYAKSDPMRLLGGPLNAAGLSDPSDGQEPYAACRLTPVDADETLWRIVGGRTGLAPGVQEKMWRTFPALAEAEFVRHGALVQALYLQSPGVLEETLRLRKKGQIFVAGGLTGVCSYGAAAALGWIGGTNATRAADGQDLLVAPGETMTGSILQHIAHGRSGEYTAALPNFGFLPAFRQSGGDNRDPKIARSEHALKGMRAWADELGIEPVELSSDAQH